MLATTPEQQISKFQNFADKMETVKVTTEKIDG